MEPGTAFPCLAACRSSSRAVVAAHRRPTAANSSAGTSGAFSRGPTSTPRQPFRYREHHPTNIRPMESGLNVRNRWPPHLSQGAGNGPIRRPYTPCRRRLTIQCALRGALEGPSHDATPRAAPSWKALAKQGGECYGSSSTALSSTRPSINALLRGHQSLSAGQMSRKRSTHCPLTFPVIPWP